MPKRAVVAIDFDGTICTHEFPDLGKLLSEAIEWMLKFQEVGARLILLTMRDDNDKVGPVLSDAIELCREHGIEFWAVNENPEQKAWTDSPKVYANFYIDDNAVGCPLVYPPNGKRPYVDWSVIGPMVLEKIKGKA